MAYNNDQFTVEHQLTSISETLEIQGSDEPSIAETSYIDILSETFDDKPFN